jgi:hypothetical protein
VKDCFALLVMLASVPAYADAASSGDIAFQTQVAGPATSFPRAFTPHVVESWNSYAHDGIVRSFHSHGADIEPSAATVSTTVVSFGDHQVLKSREEIPSKLFIYQYAGVVGSDVVLFLCSSRTARPFEATGSECEKRAAKVFDSGPAASTQWKKLGTNSKGITQYFDGASLRKEGALRYYSLKYELPSPHSFSRGATTLRDHCRLKLRWPGQIKPS